MVNLLLALGFIVFAFLSWRNQRTGLWLIFLMLPAYLLQFELLSIPTTVLEISIYILMIVFIARNFSRLWHSIGYALRPIWIPLVLLLVGLMVGTLVAPDIRLALGILKGWFVDPILLYILAVNLIDWEKIQHYIFALVLSILPMSVIAMWQVISDTFITVDGRASAWFVSPNYLSMYLVPIMLLGLMLIFGKNQIYKWVVIPTLLISLVALYFSYSYGGWLALAGGLVILGIIYLVKNWKIWIGGIVILAVAVLSQLGNEKFIKMFDFNEKSSLSVRFQVWETGIVMIKENWLTGIGLGQFRDQYLDFASRIFAPPMELAILHAHNLYFQFWINLGIIGLIGIIWLIVKFYLLIKNNLNFDAILIVAAFSSIIIHGFIDTTYWKNDLSALFWILMACAIIWNHSHNSPTNKKQNETP